jgi:hypothetical protein
MTTTTTEFGRARKLATTPEDRARVTAELERAKATGQELYASYLAVQLEEPEPIPADRIAELEAENARLRARLAGGAM